MSAETLQHGAHQFFLELVLRFLVALFHPVLGVLLLDLQRHQSGEDSVARLRDDNLSLSFERRTALITLNALFGRLLMTSDNIADYDGEKLDLLSGALSLFRGARVKDYCREGDTVKITYAENGRDTTITYDTRKGVLV